MRMGYGTILDALASVVVLACVCYLIRYADDALHAESQDYDEGDSSSEEPTVNVQPFRDCGPASTVQVAIDLSFSEETVTPLQPLAPYEIGAIGDGILNNLPGACTCSKTSQACFSWTLSISQMNYSQSVYGYCGKFQGHPVARCPGLSDTVPRIPKNTTVAKIYVKNVSLLVKPDCLGITFECALRDKDQGIFDVSFVQTFVV